MLKIKDDVDLKELEKFRLQARYNRYTGKVEEYVTNGLVIHLTEDYKNLQITEECFTPECWEINFNTLYDLIKADLVEKVEEER